MTRLSAQSTIATVASAVKTNVFQEPLDRLALTAAIAAVPLSIAISETFLTIALVARLFRRPGTGERMIVPLSFWMWLLFAALQVSSYLMSPDRGPGTSEMRHLALLIGVAFLLPRLAVKGSCVRAWKAVFLSSSLASVVLISEFTNRVLIFHSTIAAGGAARFYLRTGGVLGNWMVYATVEAVIFAGLLSFWAVYPEQRRTWWPVYVLNLAAIALSLTRMLWIVCWLLAGIELMRRRSKWLWLAAMLPLLIYAGAPGPIRARIRGSMDPHYYPNQERIEMLRVGWRMINKHPLIGVGPGRAGEIYTAYLRPHETVPTYHGHLHNNLVQLAATCGLPVAAAALLLVLALYRDLFRVFRAAQGQEKRFCCMTSLLALTGFLISGLFDYTYGHSLALILLSFAVLSPLFIASTPDCRTGGFDRADLRGAARELTVVRIGQLSGFKRFAARKDLHARDSAVTLASALESRIDISKPCSAGHDHGTPK